MLRRITNNILFRRHISALYVTGDKARENNALLTPLLKFTLNIEERLDNFGEIQENVRRRRLEINLDDFGSEYSLYKSVSERKKAIENRRDEIAKMIKESPSPEGLITQGKQLREDLKQLKQQSYYLEGNFIHNFLDLPNYIHKFTPDDEKRVIYSFKEFTSQTQASRNDLISEMIEFYDPTCYYMKGEAAKFDLFMPMQVLGYYQDNGFVNFSNPDFTRTIIGEAAGINIKDLYLIKEDDKKLNLLHLTGNASFLNYLPFITKLSIYPTILPLKFICSGKQYDARNHYEHQDLYKVVQSTCCQTFIATTDASSFDVLVDEQVEHFINTFEKFDQHFRIVYYPAHELQQAESCKIGVEMFSSSLSSYVEVGNFSCYGDYISKRLLFNYKIGKDFHFPHIYSGTVVNVMKLLLILLENVDDFKCPEWI